MKINNIEFDIKNIEVTRESTPIYFGFQQRMVPGKTEIIITAQTDNRNYMAFENWVESRCKKEVNYNGIFIAGIFPREYSFNQYNIDVTFSADYFSGDISLLRQRKLRKEKLERINKLLPLYNVEI